MSKLSKIWDFYLNQRTSQNKDDDEYFFTKLIDENAQHSFYAGVNENNSILIALESKLQPPIIEEKVDAIKSFRHQRYDGKWFFVIQLVNYELRNVFEKLCDDLISASLEIKSTEVALSITIKRLKLWINLLNKSKNGFLEDFQIRGLLAELNFIKLMVIEKKFTLSQMINSWVGPNNSPQDFIFNKEAYEIKSVALEKKSLSISSLEQLDFKDNLHIVVSEFLQCSSNDIDSTNLNIMSDNISRLIDDSDLLLIFKTKLLEVGYFSNPYYDSKNYQIIKSYKMKVDENFPKLLRSNVSCDVLGASYEINIEKIPKLIM
jgi:hypothetical protein